ncbi:MAG: hypothetical protein M3209_10975 [Acidobacteriota bacterium]|nr:hypothetical protein [Acidobacteriota bacterium]
MTEFRVTRIKPPFINKAVLAQVAADALAKLNPETRDGKRWANAIGKAVATIENNPQMVYDLRTASLHITGSRGIRYTANGTCQCEAYNGGFPCYHRAATRLIERYLEVVQ